MIRGIGRSTPRRWSRPSGRRSSTYGALAVETCLTIMVDRFFEVVGATASRGCLVNRFASGSATVDVDNWRALRSDSVRVPLVPGGACLYAGRLPRPAPVVQCSVGFRDAIVPSPRSPGRRCAKAIRHAAQRQSSRFAHDRSTSTPAVTPCRVRSPFSAGRFDCGSCGRSDFRQMTPKLSQSCMVKVPELSRVRRRPQLPRSTRSGALANGVPSRSAPIRQLLDGGWRFECANRDCS